MSKINGFVCSVVVLAVLLATAVNSPAQNNSVAGYQFLASAAESCGSGTIRFFGYSYGYQQTTQFGVSITSPYYGAQDSFLIYEWTMADEAGNLAQGSYNSTTGTSTGGSYGSSIDFTIPRYPVGDLTFQANGTVRGTGGFGSPCTQSFAASTYTAQSGGGYFNLNVDTDGVFRFQNIENNLFLQVADANDYTPAVLGTLGEANQVWTLTAAAGNGRYDIANTLSAKPIFSDFLSGSASVFQLAGATRGWRFVSTGDGTTLYIVYGYNNRLGDPQYALQPVDGSTHPVAVEAVPRNNAQKQKWFITTQ